MLAQSTFSANSLIFEKHLVFPVDDLEAMEMYGNCFVLWSWVENVGRVSISLSFLKFSRGNGETDRANLFHAFFGIILCKEISR